MRKIRKILFSPYRIISRIGRQLTPDNISKTHLYIKDYGWRRFSGKTIEKLLFFMRSGDAYFFNDTCSYQRWIMQNEPTNEELLKRIGAVKDGPLISIIVPTFNTPEKFLSEMINSVKSQTYRNWQLCIADGSAINSSARRFLKKLVGQDERIKIKFLEKNFGIARNTNDALKLAKGRYVAFLDHDDVLAHFALEELTKAISKHPGADLIYSDEDKLSSDGKVRSKPHFKPDWSPDTLRSYNYITHLLVVKHELLIKVGLFKEEFEGAQDYDLVLRVAEKAKKILHISKILYHWREHQGSTAQNIKSKSYAQTSAMKAVEKHLERIGMKASVSEGAFFGSCKVEYKINKEPLVSIIIPNHDQAKVLKTCVNSILTKSSFQNYEILIVENNSTEAETLKLYDQLKSQDSRIKVVDWNHQPFNFSEINNFAVTQSKGSVLLFLNNDMEVINSSWLEEMLQYAQRFDVGAVGAKLLYPDETIQHAGVIIGIGGIAGHSHKNFPKNSLGYYGRLQVVQNISAVTGACLMVRKESFLRVDGFDPNYPLAFGDVDLCLKFLREGYLNIWTPNSELFHYESRTRGTENSSEKQERFQGEVEYFYSKWTDFLGRGDPYYNPNLTLNREDFCLS